MSVFHKGKTIREAIEKLEKIAESYPDANIGEFWMAYDTGNCGQFGILGHNCPQLPVSYATVTHLVLGCEMHTDEDTSAEWIEDDDEQFYTKESDEDSEDDD